LRAILQRVSNAHVTVDDNIVGQIGAGWVVLLGVSRNDNDQDLAYIIDKTLHLRGFRSEDAGFDQNLFKLLPLNGTADIPCTRGHVLGNLS